MTVAKTILTHVYAKAETTFGTAVEPVATDALIPFDYPKINQVHNREIRDDYHPDTRDILEVDDLDKTGTFEIPAYMLGGGTQGVAPDIDPILLTMFEKDSLSSTTVASDVSTTTFKAADDYFDVGDIVKIDIEDVNGNIIERRAVAITDKAAGVCTYWPPTDNAPTAGDALKAMVNYKLEDDNTDSCSLYVTDNVDGSQGNGCKLTDIAWSCEKGQQGKVDLKGIVKEKFKAITTTLDGALLIGDTTVTFTKQGFEEGSIAYIEDSVTNDEAIKLGPTTDGKTFTNCTRSYGAGAAAAHADTTIARPYKYTDTTVGQTIIATAGNVWIGNSAGAFAICVDSINVQVQSNSEGVSCFGDETIDSIQNAANRTVSVSLEGAKVNDNYLELMAMVDRGDTLRVFIQAGQTDARHQSFYLPKVKFESRDESGEKGQVRANGFTSVACLYDTDDSIPSLTIGQ